MKKIILAAFALSALVSCRSLIEEWQPVFDFGKGEGAFFVPVTVDYLKENEGLKEFTTIKELKAMYKGTPIEISGNVWIKGQVVSSDHTGNIYREMYIQDETGAIDIKMGKSALYSEYALGQWIYVKCDGLSLGQYSGMPQLGFTADQTSTNTYDTSYIDNQAIINMHFFRGFRADPVRPSLVTEDAIKASIAAGFYGELWGKYVTIKDVQYGAEPSYADDPYKRIFIFLNVDPYKDKQQTSNRVRISKGTYGVTTWALSKNLFLYHLDNGDFDDCETYDGVKFTQVFDPDTGETVKEVIRKNATGVSTTQYFHVGGTALQIRTSGFCDFSDIEIDPEILGNPDAKDGAIVTVTGILSTYNGGAQLAFIDDPSIAVVKQ